MATVFWIADWSVRDRDFRTQVQGSVGCTAVVWRTVIIYVGAQCLGLEVQGPGVLFQALSVDVF